MKKTDAQLREDIKAAESFLRGLRGRRGSEFTAQERAEIYAAGRQHADRAATARRELAERGPRARAAMRADANTFERLRQRFGNKNRTELRQLAETEAKQQRQERQAARQAELQARHGPPSTPTLRQSKTPKAWRLEDGGGMRLASLFGSPTLWAMATSRGESGQFEEVLSAADVATLWWVCGRMEESGVDCFVIEHGQRRGVHPLRDLPGWKASLDRLTEVGLLTREQPRGRIEYRLGRNATRIIAAGGDNRTLPFARVEDQDPTG